MGEYCYHIDNWHVIGYFSETTALLVILLTAHSVIIGSYYICLWQFNTTPA